MPNSSITILKVIGVKPGIVYRKNSVIPMDIIVIKEKITVAIFSLGVQSLISVSKPPNDFFIAASKFQVHLQ